MDSLSKRHNSLRRKIKNLDEQIPKKEAKLEELESIYVGVKGNCKKDDRKRKKNIADKKQLRKEISTLKAKRRKYRKILKDDKNYIKRISLIFKSKNHTTAVNRYNRLLEKKEEMSEEIRKFFPRARTADIFGQVAISGNVDING